MSDFQQRMQVELPSPAKLFTPVVTTFLVLYIAGYALICHLREFTITFLALSAPGVLQGKVWQLVTYSFINGCPWNLIFDLMIMLFIGSMVERQWKSGRVLLLWLASTVICGLIFVMVAFVFRQPYLGVGGAPFSYAVIAAFGLLFRKQKVFFYFTVVEAQVVACILIGVGLVINIARPIYWIFIGGALVGYLYVKFMQGNPLGLSGRSRPTGPSVRSGGFVDLD